MINIKGHKNFISFFKRNPNNVKKPRKEALKNNEGSTFFKIYLEKPIDEDKIFNTKLLKYGIISLRTNYVSEYFVEFDNHQNSKPHFHLWRANGSQKIQDTRSAAISLNTSLNKGINYSYKENKNEVKLNNVQSAQVVRFVEENRFLLYLMYTAFKQGKAKSFVNMSEEQLYSLFSRYELNLYARKFENMYGEPVSYISYE